MATRLGFRTGAVMLAICALSFAADLPEKLQKDIDKAKSDYEEAGKSAEKRLLTAFDAEIEFIRKQPRLKAEAKQEAIEAVAAERVTFEKHGTLPFSPRMREAAMSYLKTTRQAERPVATSYDKAIELHTKAKDNAAAAVAVAEKKKVLKSRVIGVWACAGANFKDTFNWTLYADGTAQPNNSTWILDKDKLVITNRAPVAPLGGWIETCILDSSGQTFVAKNQRGGTYTGKRADPPKE